MAKLLSYYNVCTIADQNGFLGLSPDKNEDNVIISIGRNLVYTLHVSNLTFFLGPILKRFILLIQCS